jgi:hypothetical protein
MDKRSLNLVVAVTDDDWFEMLRHQKLNEVNFWAPSAASFRALQPGEMFLFKLHAPRNAIVGGGIFAYANALPWRTSPHPSPTWAGSIPGACYGYLSAALCGHP